MTHLIAMMLLAGVGIGVMHAVLTFDHRAKDQPTLAFASTLLTSAAVILTLVSIGA